MSELFLVRHAQASYGSDDYDRLSDLGHQQARWLGEYFRTRKLVFDQVICGNMVRHHETLEDISNGMDQPVPAYTVVPGWNEFDFQSLIQAYLLEHPDERPDTGAPRKEFSNLLLKTLQAWVEDRLPANRAESFEAFERRVRTALLVATGQAAPGSKVLVVSSGGAISAALKQVLKTPPSTMLQMNIQTRNSSFSHLYFNATNIRLSGFNHTPHLDHPDRHDAVSYY